MGLMHGYYLQREQWLSRPIDEVFAFFSRPENLQQITPSWLNFAFVEAPLTLSPGALIRYRLHLHGVPLRWTTEIVKWGPPFHFSDRQFSGPCALWYHEHSFTAENGGTTMRDGVTYALPLGWLGDIAHRLLVKKDIARVFDFRAEAMRRLFPE